MLNAEIDQEDNEMKPKIDPGGLQILESCDVQVFVSCSLRRWELAHRTQAQYRRTEKYVSSYEVGKSIYIPFDK